MSIDSSDVEKIAQLARLRLAPGESAEVTRGIGNILALIDKMQAVDTSGVEPLSHASNAGQRLREDKVTEQDQRDLLQAIAPSTADGLYLVPKVIE